MVHVHALRHARHPAPAVGLRVAWRLQARDSPALRNTKKGSPLDASGPRLDMGGMLFWDQPHCEVFRTMLCHPKLVPYLTELCGLGYRLDHQPLLVAQARDGWMDGWMDGRVGG